MHKYCELPRVLLREGPLPSMLLPYTRTMISAGLGQAGDGILNVLLQSVFELQAETGISVEPQIFPETESKYATV